MHIHLYGENKVFSESAPENAHFIHPARAGYSAMSLGETLGKQKLVSRAGRGQSRWALGLACCCSWHRWALHQAGREMGRLQRAAESCGSPSPRLRPGLPALGAPGPALLHPLPRIQLPLPCCRPSLSFLVFMDLYLIILLLSFFQLSKKGLLVSGHAECNLDLPGPSKPFVFVLCI